MTRISLTEQYDDRDVIAQIVRLKDGLEDISGGVIADIQIVNNDLVIQWADGSSVTLPLPDPVTGISSITGSVSGGNLTITFYFTNGTTHSFTCPLSGMASETYVNTLDAQNVKLTGAQSIGGVKTFTDSPSVPDSPANLDSAVNSTYVNDATDGVNNIVHKSGTEVITGVKEFTQKTVRLKDTSIALPTDDPASDSYFTIQSNAANSQAITQIAQILYANGTHVFRFQFVRSSSGNTGYLDFGLDAAGNMTLMMSKTVNGVTTSNTIATL